MAGEAGVLVGGAAAIEDEGEAHGEERGPEEQEKDEGERTVDAKELLARAGAAEAIADRDPGSPGEDEEEVSDAKAAGGAARDDDGLNGVRSDETAAEQTEEDDEPVHDRESPGLTFSVAERLTGERTRLAPEGNGTP